MSNPYTPNQPWDQSQMLFGQQNLHLDQNYNMDPYAEQAQQRRQPQLPQQQQLPPYQGSFHYQQQQAPSASGAPHSSSLQGALQSNQASSHSRSSSYNSLSPQLSQPSNSYGNHSNYSGIPNPPVSQAPNPSYRNNTHTFSFGATNLPGSSMPMAGTDNIVPGGAFMSGPPSTMQEPFSHSSGRLDQSSRPYQSNQISTGGQPSAKRARPVPQDDTNAEDAEKQGAPDDSKDKAKPPRACARCKNLKVRCEAKTDNEPCKRCLNGGHECFIPGRKIRRVPPKREHLINQIQSQAKEIERLMKQLEGSGKSDGSQGTPTRQTTPSSPVLSPATTDSYLDAPSRNGDPATNKAIEDWIAKTRENMQELKFICVGGAGAPESYVVEEDFEDSDSSSGDDEFVDVREELDDDYDNDHYEVAVEGPDGGQYTGPSLIIRHRSSASSMGTTKSGATHNTQRKKHSGDKEKPANLPVEASPFGLFGNLSLKTSRPRSRVPSEIDEDEDKGAGIDNQDFFRPTPAPAALIRRAPTIEPQAPAILTKGLITPAEAEKLFHIYYEEINLSVSLLDPVLYDAKRTFWRSPFLFTVICAISSRFYEERPDLYQQAMHYAQLAAGNALINGTKNVEMCAAYILMSLYPIPVKRWENQRGWLYLGLAIRTATDLNLHLPMTAKPRNENHAREMLNRTRIWLNCFNVDRSTGSQYGKPPTIGNTDYTANHSENWWHSSPFNMQHFDIHISAYNAELRLMSKFIAKIYSDPDHPTGLNKEVDFEALATQADDDLQREKAKWFSILDKTDMSDPQNCFRTCLLRLAYSYARLIALSYGFQHAFGKNDGQDENPFLMRCLSAASDVVNAVVRDIPASLRHYIRHGPEAQSVFVTFASAFLVKLLQPKFASYLSHEQRVAIRDLVQQVVDVLSEVSIDDRHGPKLYSRFLQGLLAKPLAKIDPSAPDVPLPPRSRSRKTKTAANHDSMDSTQSGDYKTHIINQGSPATSSPSPPPAESIASFDNFRPAGGIDPYAPDDAAAYVMNSNVGGNSSADLLMSDYFQPELPFDEEIVRSIQDLSDPSGWQDISIPGTFNALWDHSPIILTLDVLLLEGFNWMTQFQQNMGLDLRSASSSMGNMQYPANNNNSNNNAAANMMYDPNTMQQYLTGGPR
ncbi:hypothetical protein EST38_g1583 [Candolleomyces aberdarensis]|uniref:Zn(2)-C6 fungal-type domain-containing protein n=1 Tax=Candolleomyces aberdarensis TaxID=2316362 RepID=A0A4V1Q543_9AGAR|nr:hypothetical protein EST38_g1583 [Candolleomyces aberdarensis]